MRPRRRRWPRRMRRWCGARGWRRRRLAGVCLAVPPGPAAVVRLEQAQVTVWRVWTRWLLEPGPRAAAGGGRTAAAAGARVVCCRRYRYVHPEQYHAVLYVRLRHTAVRASVSGQQRQQRQAQRQHAAGLAFLQQSGTEKLGLQGRHDPALRGWCSRTRSTCRCALSLHGFVGGLTLTARAASGTAGLVAMIALTQKCFFQSAPDCCTFIMCT